MKLRTIFILSTVFIVVCYVSPVKAQSQVTRLEEGTLNWKVENRQLSHYSVTKKDGTKLPKDKYIGSLRDFRDRKSTRLNSSHVKISYAVFCLKKKKKTTENNHNTEIKDQSALWV